MTSLTKQTIAYGIGTILTKLQAFLFLPILAHHLSKSEFGKIEALTTLSFLVGIFSTINIDLGLGTHFGERTTSGEANRLSSSAIWLNALLCVPILALAVAFRHPLTSVLSLQADETFLLITGILSAQATGAASLQYTLLRLKFATNTFVIVSVVSAILNGLSSVTSVVYFNLGATGVISSNLFSNAITILALSIINRHEILTPPRFSDILLLIRSGIPLIPFSASAWILASLDKSMIAAYRGLDDVGLYAIASRLAAAASLVFAPFQTAWWPFAMASANKPNRDEIFDNALRAFTVLASFVTVLTGTVSPLLLYLLFPTDYSLASRYVGLLVFSNMLTILYYFPLVSLMVAKKSWITSVCYVAGAAITFSLHFVTIPLYGVSGAICSSLLGYVTMLAAVTYFANRSLPIRYAYRELSILLVGLLAIVFCPLVLYRPTATFTVLHFLFSVSSTLILVYLSGIVSPSMRSKVSEHLKSKRLSFALYGPLNSLRRSTSLRGSDSDLEERT